MCCFPSLMPGRYNITINHCHNPFPIGMGCGFFAPQMFWGGGCCNNSALGAGIGMALGAGVAGIIGSVINRFC